MTDFIKKKEIKNNWVLINAENAIVGRLAAYISKLLRGKTKSYRHTNHPGGIKETTPLILMNKKPEEVLKLAVKRMLPSGPLSKKQMSKLKIYKGSLHPHESQNPKIIDFAKFNTKNYISIN